MISWEFEQQNYQTMVSCDSGWYFRMIRRHLNKLRHVKKICRVLFSCCNYRDVCPYSPKREVKRTLSMPRLHVVASGCTCCGSFQPVNTTLNYGIHCLFYRRPAFSMYRHSSNVNSVGTRHSFYTIEMECFIIFLDSGCCKSLLPDDRFCIL
ncbi:hypothetical protein OIU76_002577 [Salix suchowensis]|nr:hypothetical protein OIU76_002577 [Salix suchowensis]